MTDVKQAVRTAFDYIQQLYPSELPGLRLEEVQLSEDEHRWLITMGFLEATDPANIRQPASVIEALSQIQSYKPVQAQRVYKRIEIDAATGERGASANRHTPSSRSIYVGKIG